MHTFEPIGSSHVHTEEDHSMSVMPDLTGRVCLVTGASRGIGRAIALGLAESGGDVAINCRSNIEEAQAVASAVEAMGRKAAVVQADVSQSADVARMVTATEAALGPVDILVNNAGMALRRTVDELTEADFDVTIAVNLKSAFLCTQAVLPHMRAQRWGRIVNISSGAARGAGAIGFHYNASKAGMEGLTRGYAARLVTEGVTFNAVAPTLIETEDMPAARVAAGASIPLGRLGRGEEVAQATLMVIANAYMTGQTVQLNGGMYFI
jgi:3-oxoacyl-[acyl-carrier protein] reductase